MKTQIPLKTQIPPHRPYIICHMVTSLDGKVTGEFLGKQDYHGLIERYYQIHKSYHADGFICGRVTMASSFPQPAVQPVPYAGPALDRKDFFAAKAPFYAVAVDPHGKLWWDAPALSDPDEGYDGAQIIEVLTEQVSDAFLAHLRARSVSYLFAGKEKLDMHLVVEKLLSLFGIKTLLLEGGGIINGTFLEAGLIDELSLVVAPSVEPSAKEISLFHTSPYQTKPAAMTGFQLHAVEKLTDSGLWLTYRKS